MAIAITKPSSQIGNSGNVAVYSMAPTFLPAQNCKVVVGAHASGTVTGSISGNGSPAWAMVGSMNPQGGGHSGRLWRGDINGAPSSLSINVDYTGDNATGCCAAAIQITGAQSGNALQAVSVGSIGANPVVTFPSSVLLGNAVVVVLCSVGTVGTITPPSGWTTIAASYGTPTTGLVLAYADSMSAATFTFSTGALTALAYMAAEFAASPNGSINIAPFLSMRRFRMNA